MLVLAASSVLGDVQAANVTPAVYNPGSGQAYVTRVATRKVVVRRRTKKKSAAIIGGSAAAGAGVGALAGGKKGAVVGALVGGGSGAVYDRATHKKTVTVRQ